MRLLKIVGAGWSVRSSRSRLVGQKSGMGRPKILGPMTKVIYRWITGRVPKLTLSKGDSMSQPFLRKLTRLPSAGKRVRMAKKELMSLALGMSCRASLKMLSEKLSTACQVANQKAMTLSRRLS